MLVTYLVLTLLQHTQLSVLQPALCGAAKSYPGVNKHHLSNSAHLLLVMATEQPMLQNCQPVQQTLLQANLLTSSVWTHQSIQCMGHTLLSSALHTAI